MPPLPTQITEADNVKHEIHYTLADRPKDVVVAAYTKVEATSSSCSTTCTSSSPWSRSTSSR